MDLKGGRDLISQQILAGFGYVYLCQSLSQLSRLLLGKQSDDLGRLECLADRCLDGLGTGEGIVRGVEDGWGRRKEDGVRKKRKWRGGGGGQVGRGQVKEVKGAWVAKEDEGVEERRMRRTRIGKVRRREEDGWGKGEGRGGWGRDRKVQEWNGGQLG